MLVSHHQMKQIEEITKNLNVPQKEAVTHHEGPLLILAGAGSGKTRVLTHRMAHLIFEGKAAADEILCLTFTNKAAKEMEHRIYQIISQFELPIWSELWISTFHSFCVRILRQHIELLHYKRPFTIYDTSDQISTLKKVLQQLNINEKMHSPKSFLSRISNCKMLGKGPEELKNSPKHFMDQKTAEVYTHYEAALKQANALDFDDLLLKTYELFNMYPDILEAYQNKFKYIMVDEYQDTNHIQYLLVKILAAKNKNLCVVGDEDQSIYSWRGADISNILNFEEDFKSAKTIKLEENYRSTQTIVNAATAVISNNTERKEKTIFTNNEEGTPISLHLEKNEYEEARFVAKTIESMIAEGESNLNDYAIFYRTNAQSRVLEEQLRALSLPYRLIGGIRFYERAEIKDMISYMRLSLNRSDDVAARRIINVPARGIGKTTVEKVSEVADEHKTSFLEAIRIAVEQRNFNAGTTSKLRGFYSLIESLTDLALSQADGSYMRPSEFYSVLLDKTEYLTALKKENTPEADARINNLEELSNALVQFEKERGEDASLSHFLEELALASDLDNSNESQNAITLMTLHISKGLEYPFVFIVGCEENLFPSGLHDGEDESAIEEERRLAYVGMTRARKKLWMTYARVRRVWGQEQINPPSRFLEEIPKQYVKFTSGIQSYDSSSFAQRYAKPSAWGSKNNSYDSDYQAFPDYDSDDSDSSYAQSTKSEYKKGQRVRHPTFGAGSIYEIEGSGEDLKVSVLFQNNTLKKFVAKYARLERI